MNLSDEARQARNAYFKRWREKNRDKVKAAQVRYWQKKAGLVQQQKGGAVHDG